MQEKKKFLLRGVKAYAPKRKLRQWTNATLAI
jgi:hypothetical protein